MENSLLRARFVSPGPLLFWTLLLLGSGCLAGCSSDAGAPPRPIVLGAGAGSTSNSGTSTGATGSSSDTGTGDTGAAGTGATGTGATQGSGASGSGTTPADGDAATLLATASTCPTQVGSNLPTDDPADTGGVAASTPVTLCRGASNGPLWFTGDLDIDCDGSGLGAGGCGVDPAGQVLTACGDGQLDSNTQRFVVWPGAQPGLSTMFAGVQCGTVVAASVNGKVVCGIAGDVTEHAGTGEMSWAMCNAFGLPPDSDGTDPCSPTGGGLPDGVTYMYFTNQPILSDWASQSDIDAACHSYIQALR